MLDRLLDAYVQGDTAGLPQIADALRELRGAWSALTERGTGTAA